MAVTRLGNELLYITNLPSYVINLGHNYDVKRNLQLINRDMEQQHSRTFELFDADEYQIMDKSEE